MDDGFGEAGDGGVEFADLVGEGGDLVGEVEGFAGAVEGGFRFFDGFDFGIDAGVVHAVDDDADDEVEHDHGAEEDEGDEVGGGEDGLGLGFEGGVVEGEVGGADVVALIDVGAVNLEIHDVGPVFEGDDAEEGEEGVENIAEVDGVVFGKEHHSGDGVDVKEKEEQDGDVEHGGKALEEGVDEELELGDGGEESQNTQESEESEHGTKPSAGGEEADGDDDEVEDVPAVFEEVLGPGGKGDHLDCDFGDEDEKDEGVEEFEKVVVFGDGGFVGLDADEDAGKEDDRDDEAVEERGVDQGLAARFHGGENLRFSGAGKDFWGNVCSGFWGEVYERGKIKKPPCIRVAAESKNCSECFYSFVMGD